jgi:ArsR family transcriptional regulator
MYMTSQEPDYTALSQRIKLLAHPERLRILDVLRREPECVCHLEALLDKPQPYVSQQLRLLRELKVIQDQKEGNNVFYHLVDREIAAWLEQILGPATGEHAGIARQKQLIDCGCPKCGNVESHIDHTLATIELIK